MSTESEQKSKGHILIVDDTPTDLHLLSSLLSDQGFAVRSIPNGKLALQSAIKDPPELILLDIEMPGMDGYAVCEALKAQESLKKAPVLFISALNDTVDKVRGFQLGGVDYITKPFQFEEVLSRINAHLGIRRLQSELEERYEELKKLESLRDSLTHMIVHDMRSPIMGINGYLEILWSDLAQNLPLQNREDLEQARNIAASLIEMVSSLLDVSRLESNKMPLTIAAHEAPELIQSALNNLGSLTKSRRIQYRLPEKEPSPAFCDGPITIRIITNLLANAIKFTPSGGIIIISCQELDQAVQISISDNGPGIPPEYRESVFDKFGQVQGRQLESKWSTGLGLTFCKLAVEAQGGSIGVESADDQGSLFWFTVPTQPLSKNLSLAHSTAKADTSD